MHPRNGISSACLPLFNFPRTRCPCRHRIVQLTLSCRHTGEHGVHALRYWGYFENGRGRVAGLAAAYKCIPLQPQDVRCSRKLGMVTMKRFSSLRVSPAFLLLSISPAPLFMCACDCCFFYSNWRLGQTRRELLWSSNRSDPSFFEPFYALL